MTSAGHLPHIDEHRVEIEAPPAAAWSALLRVLDGSFDSASTSKFARLLGCADTAASGPRPLTDGSTVPGFHVEAAKHNSELALRGRHRFSDYALIFRLDELNGDCTRLRAETRAVFPGLRGAAYKALVIGTRGHVLVTRRLLNAVKRRANSTAQPTPS